MNRFFAICIYSLALISLMGCGSSSGNSTVLTGSVDTASGLSTSSLSLKVTNLDEDFSEDADLDDGEFRLTSVPEGLATIEVRPSSSATESLQFVVDIEDGETSDIELSVLTWDPEPIGEYRTKEGNDESFSETRPLGPSGTTRIVESDGDRMFETPAGLVVLRKADGSVEVDETNYTETTTDSNTDTSTDT